MHNQGHEQRARFYQKIHDHFDGDLKGDDTNLHCGDWPSSLKPMTFGRRRTVYH